MPVAKYSCALCLKSPCSLFVTLLLIGLTSMISAQVIVTNTLDVDRKDAVIRLGARLLHKQTPGMDFSAVKFVADSAIPFQAIDENGDGTTDMFLLVMDLPAKGSKTISIQPLAAGETLEFTKRTQAEISHKINGQWKDREYVGGEFVNVDYLKPPPQHKDHSWFIRYEGPGWESDKVGYRFYLDWRDATDIFGKLTHDMVLQDVGLDGFDSYHEPGTWGMDVLKVGESLGVGALGTWMDDHALRVEKTDSFICRIVRNGDLESMIRTNYYAWQVGDVRTDVISEMSIEAGSRMTKHHVTLSNSLPNLCTGIVKDPSSAAFSKQLGSYGYLATWGKQSLAEDLLGMAVIYRTDDLLSQTEDKHSHVVVLSPKNNQLTYYFLAAWEQEPDGIRTEEEFKTYLDQQLTELNTPVVVSFKK